MGNHSISYVLITPARNEETFIETTIQSVIKQTILPVKWVIVNDGSTDATSKHCAQISRRSSMDGIGGSSSTRRSQLRRKGICVQRRP